MSHNVRLDGIKFKNMAILRQAVQELKNEGANIDLMEGNGLVARASGVGARDIPCEVMLKVHDYKWDVGFNRNAEGDLVPEIESMFRHPSLSAGHDAKALDQCQVNYGASALGQLSARYAIIQAETNAAMAGHSTTRSFDARTRQFQLEVV